MDTEYILTANGELYHWGIKGMKWGIRRYQNKDGSLTPAGKKKYAAEMAKVKAETTRVKNQQKVDAKLKKLDDAKKNLRDLKKGKVKENYDPKEDIAAKKARILESRSAKQLYDNANLFTTNELNAAKLRLELERNIKNLEPATVDKGKQYANKFVDAANNIADITQAGSKAYNNVAKIYNTFYGNRNNKSLPMINESVTSKLDKFKEETDWIKAKNDRKKAVEDSKEKVKSDLDKLKEETARIDAENKNREAKRASRAHDEKDRREAEKAERDADEAKTKAYKETTEYKKHNDPYTDPKTSTNTSYRNSGGDRTYTNPNESRGLSVPNNSVTGLSKTNVSQGKTYVNDYAKQSYQELIDSSTGNVILSWGEKDDD